MDFHPRNESVQRLPDLRRGAFLYGVAQALDSDAIGLSQVGVQNWRSVVGHAGRDLRRENKYVHAANS
jgi:hypothetical protein